MEGQCPGPAVMEGCQDVCGPAPPPASQGTPRQGFKDAGAGRALVPSELQALRKSGFSSWVVILFIMRI